MGSSSNPKRQRPFVARTNVEGEVSLGGDATSPPKPAFFDVPLEEIRPQTLAPTPLGAGVAVDIGAKDVLVRSSEGVLGRIAASFVSKVLDAATQTGTLIHKSLEPPSATVRLVRRA